MLHARFVHAATLLPDGTVLVAGGFNNSEGFLKSTEFFDPNRNEFIAGPDLSVPRDNPTATLLRTGKVLICGGDNEEPNYLSSTELYDPSTRTFTASGNMTSPRVHHTQTLLKDGRVLITGGNMFDPDGSMVFLANAEIYDPATGLFIPTGSMGTGRRQHRAALLPDGRVLITGGYHDNDVTLGSAEIYDPATGLFTPTGSLTQARAAHSMAVLKNGQVLVTGGEFLDGINPIATRPTVIEVYNQSTGRFKTVGNLLHPRSLHNSVTLDSGDVLIAGGLPARKVYNSSAELFVPSDCTGCD